MQQKPVLSIGEAATAIGVSTATLRRWIEAGHLRARRTPGGHYLIDATDLEAFIASMVIQPAAVTS